MRFIVALLFLTLTVVSNAQIIKSNGVMEMQNMSFDVPCANCSEWRFARADSTLYRFNRVMNVWQPMDLSLTNEIQDFTISGDTLFIEGGNFVILPLSSQDLSGIRDSLDQLFGAAPATDTTRIVVYKQAHGYGDIPSVYDGGILPLKENFNLATAANANDLPFTYAIDDVGADSLLIKQSGVLTRTSHGLTIGRVYYLQNTAGTLDTVPGSIEVPVLLVLDANTIQLIDRSGAFAANVLRIFIPTSQFTSRGADPKAPRDSIVQEIAQTYQNAGLARPGAIFVSQLAATTSNPSHQAASSESSTPFNVWFWDGERVTRISYGKIAINLQDTVAGGLGNIPMIPAASPSEADVLSFIDNNYESVSIPNGTILYWGGTEVAPDTAWVVLDNVSDATKRVLLIKDKPGTSVGGIYGGSGAVPANTVSNTVGSAKFNFGMRNNDFFDFTGITDTVGTTGYNIGFNKFSLSGQYFEVGLTAYSTTTTNLSSVIAFQSNGGGRTPLVAAINQNNFAGFTTQGVTANQPTYAYIFSTDGIRTGNTAAPLTFTTLPNVRPGSNSLWLFLTDGSGAYYTPSALPFTNPYGGTNTLSAAIDSLIANAGSGAVSSVDLSAPAQFNVTGGPVTSSGTLALAWATQSANTFLAGPTTGGAAAPTFRGLASADIAAGGGVTGSGTANRVAKFTSSTAVGNSNIFDDGTTVVINGTNPTSPSFQFEIQQQDAISFFSATAFGAAAGTFPLFYLTRSRGSRGSPSAVQSGDILGAIGFAGAANSTPALFRGSNIVSVATANWTTGSTPAYLAFETVPTGSTTRNERVRIQPDGTVGIGITSPLYNLDIAGTGVRIPLRTTASRPTGNNGVLGANSTWGGLDFYYGAWRRIPDLPDATPSEDARPVYEGSAWTTRAPQYASIYINADTTLTYTATTAQKLVGYQTLASSGVTVGTSDFTITSTGIYEINLSITYNHSEGNANVIGAFFIDNAPINAGTSFKQLVQSVSDPQTASLTFLGQLNASQVIDFRLSLDSVTGTQQLVVEQSHFSIKRID